MLIISSILEEVPKLPFMGYTKLGPLHKPANCILIRFIFRELQFREQLINRMHYLALQQQTAGILGTIFSKMPVQQQLELVCTMQHTLIIQ